MHLSYSQVNSYRLCPEYWKREKLEGDFLGLTTVSMSRGSGVHRGAEENFKQKIESHEDLPVAEIVDASVTGFEEALERDGFGLWLNPDERAMGKPATVANEMDRTVRLATLFGTDLAPQVQPDLVEVKGKVEIIGAENEDDRLDFIGYIDVVENERIHDMKTAARAKPKGEAHGSFQLTSYAALYFASTGRWPEELELDVLVDTKKPKLQVLVTERDRGDLDAWMETILGVHAAIKAGVFPPAPIGSWKCAPKWCPAWSSCKYVSKSSDRRLAADV